MTERITERPFNPRYLFNTGPNTAELESNFGDKGAYVHGFLDAAYHLAQQLEANRLGVDIVVYPAIYLLRHGLELGFKAILATYYYEAEGADRTWHGHSLEFLWQQLSPQLEPIDGSYDESEYFEPGAAAYIGDLVQAIHNVDPDGEAARYDTNTDSTPTMVGIKRVNLNVLADACGYAALWMHGVLSHREFVDNLWRHERGYFNLPTPPEGPDSYDRDRKPFVPWVHDVLKRAARGKADRKQYLSSYQIFSRIPKGIRQQMTSTKGARARYGGDLDAGAKIVADIIKRDLDKRLVETAQMSPRGMSFRTSRADPLFEPNAMTIYLFRLETAPPATKADRPQHAGRRNEEAGSKVPRNSNARPTQR